MNEFGMFNRVRRFRHSRHGRVSVDYYSIIILVYYYYYLVLRKIFHVLFYFMKSGLGILSDNAIFRGGERETSDHPFIRYDKILAFWRSGREREIATETGIPPPTCARFILLLACQRIERSLECSCVCASMNAVWSASWWGVRRDVGRRYPQLRAQCSSR